ncbi:MAG: hypothetical protein JWP91_4229 [Fibrobacteres bacterium]|nr:hypothetical protein [Fibrobacterota bacterium]
MLGGRTGTGRRPSLKAMAVAIGAVMSMGTGSARAEFPVIGYWANWGGGIPDIQFQYMTHLMYSFAGVDANGAISVNDAQVKQLVSLGHAKGTKIGIALAGGGGDAGFQKFIFTPAIVAQFVKNSVAIVDKYDLDGIDMDWEYPNSSQANAFEAMMIALADEMHKKGKFLTIAVIGGDPSRGKDIHDGVVAAVDFVNIMAYDNGGTNHSPYELGTLCLDYWLLQHKIPRAKAVLGVPFYGRDPNGGSYTGYNELVKRDPTAPTKDQVGNIGYNGINTIQRKTQMAMDRGGGIMAWEISLDTHDGTSLLKAMFEKAKPLVTATLGAPQARATFSIGPDRIRFQAPAAGGYSLRILTLSGTEVGAERLHITGTGQASMAWHPGRLAPGAYTAVLQGNGFKASGRLALPGR